MPNKIPTANCDCLTWCENIRDIDYMPDAKSGLKLAGLRTYCGVVIYYCPWCGKLLEMR
jgi:hypothetical protein